MNHRILLVDDNLADAAGNKRMLELNGFEVTLAGSGQEAIHILKTTEDSFAVALVDFNMPDLNGAETCASIRTINTQIQIIGLTGDNTVEAHTETMLAGANTFMLKSSDHEGFQKLLATIRSYCIRFDEATQTVDVETLKNGSEILSKIGIKGRSQHLLEVANIVLKIAPTNISVLILGDPGTGKEKIAFGIHKNSKRASKKFIAINCGAIPESLIESQLFGHEKGSFTGAVSAHKGFFEEANGGTLFLDEIGEMKPQTQVKLLRVLQEQTITPVGSNKSIKVDVRVISATNRNIEAEVATEKFREDLFYRINGFTIKLDPLRKRNEDIEPLINFFTDKYNHEYGTQFKFLVTTVKKLEQYKWPGNIRELESFVNRTLTLSRNKLININDIDKKYIKSSEEVLKSDISYDELRKKLDLQERDFLERQLKHGGTIRKIAEALGMSNSTLQHRIKILGIKA